MENPYAHAAAPAAATPELQQLADYELAIGENAGYYIPRFEEFDKGGSKLGWHWPAFFITTPWFIYRKMWGWGLGNIAYFWGMLTFVAPIALALAAGTAGKGKGNGSGAMAMVGIILAILIAVPWFVLPIYANALYWRHINKVIRNVPSSFQQQPDKRATRIRRNGGTGAGVMIGVLIGGGFLLLAFVGILAAIAIPAYQDYTIRAQVSEGLTLAAAPKAAVAEYFAEKGEWPLDAEAAGLQAISGKYVESLHVANGSIVITYGGLAHRSVANERLILTPGLTAEKEIVWICGEHAVPPDVDSVGPGPRGSDVPNKYLPMSCRS